VDTELNVEIPSFEENLHNSIQKIDHQLSISAEHLLQFVAKTQPKRPPSKTPVLKKPGHIRFLTGRGAVSIEYSVREIKRWFRASNFIATLALSLDEDPLEIMTYPLGEKGVAIKGPRRHTDDIIESFITAILRARWDDNDEWDVVTNLESLSGLVDLSNTFYAYKRHRWRFAKAWMTIRQRWLEIIWLSNALALMFGHRK
jgi:hypothetical protein